MPSFRSLLAKLKKQDRARSWPFHGDRHQDEASVTQQIEALSLEKSSTSRQSDRSPGKPHVFGEAAFEFPFNFSARYKNTWPGPVYDESSLFAPGIFDKPRHPKRRPKQKSPKRRLSQDDRRTGGKVQAPADPKHVKVGAREKKSQPKPQFFGTAPPRSPPINLLNIPGEVRNQVYRLLYLRSEPLVAQFRLIIRPRQGHAEKRPDNYRRFPREPILALTCRQLQQEVLSYFYGENKFVFRKSEYPKLNDMQHGPSMTRPESIERWAPKFDAVRYLAHLEVQFKAWGPSSESFCITYTFRRLRNGKLRVSNDADDTDHCACFENYALQEMKTALLGTPPLAENLLVLASRATTMRKTLLQDEPSFAAQFPYKMYRPTRLTCNECGLEHLTEVASGL